MIGNGNNEIYEFGPWAEKNSVDLSWVLNWDFVAAECTEYGSLFHVTGPRWGKVRCPWNFFFCFGIRKVRVSAEECNEWDGMYR